jgi:hypothetical protein
MFSESELAVHRLRLGSVVPKEQDLHGAAQALIRLQAPYIPIPIHWIRKIRQGFMGVRKVRKFHLFLFCSLFEG